MLEFTLVIIKPDGMQKNLYGTIMSRFEKIGLVPIACKMEQLTEEILREHYDFLTNKPFFPDLLKYMQECPVIIFAFKGEDAVAKARKLIGPTDSRLAPKGSIRGDFGISKDRNVIHASDSNESAEKEISRFFKWNEVFK